MKILFVDPPRIVRKNVRTSRVKEPDLGLAYICAEEKKAGREVMIIDAFAESLGMDDISRRISGIKPDVLGMPMFTFKANEVAAIAGIAKGLNPAMKVVVGGAHASALPVKTLREFPDIDFAVRGEGEKTFSELIGCLEREEEDYSGVRGVAWRCDGEIKRNPPRAVIRDLDTLEFPDWGAFNLDLYFPIYHRTRSFLELPISSARGCRGRCAFCFRLTRGYIRARSAGSVVAEMERGIRDFGAESFIFMDESFTAEPERTHELCAAMIKAGLPGKVKWLCETRVDRVDADLLRHLREAGCIHVSFGVESGSQEVLDKNKKGTTVEQAHEAVRMTREAGMQTDVYLIFGLPYDTRKTMTQTRMFPIKANPDFANFFILVPYPGTVAMKLAEEGRANLKLLSNDWSEYGIQIGGAMELQDMKRSELERFQFISYLLFYLRPSKWKNLLRMVSFKAVPVYLYNLLLGLFRRRAN